MPQIMEKLNSSILFIGAGSMAESIIKGLIYSRVITSRHIYVMNKSNKQRLMELNREYDVIPVSTFEEGFRKAQIIILAVKPASMKDVCKEIKPLITSQHIIISVSAGVRTSLIENILGNKPEVVRAMPNTSSSICESATGISAGKYASQLAINVAKRIFDTVGEVIIVNETQLDTVTGLSGSGPAYVYYLIEGLEKAGINAGLPEEDVRKLVSQTVYGAAKMLIELHAEPAMLRKQVTSPNGTTEAGLKVLEHYDFHDILNKTVERASLRAAEIGKELEKNL
jgi:pyrroline-5-carboxylate reductase